MYYPADLLWLPATVHRTPAFLRTPLRIMSSALNKDIAGALPKALYEPSVPDLCASAVQRSAFLIDMNDARSGLRGVGVSRGRGLGYIHTYLTLPGVSSTFQESLRALFSITVTPGGRVSRSRAPSASDRYVNCHPLLPASAGFHSSRGDEWFR